MLSTNNDKDNNNKRQNYYRIHYYDKTISCYKEQLIYLFLVETKEKEKKITIV